MHTRECKMVEIRKPVVAGQFYPGSKDGLIQQITDCFMDKRGCGILPKIEQGEKDIIGLVVPHAGYIYSGAIASFTYQYLAAHGFADSFIILGPNHTGEGSGVSVMTNGSWETPLGDVHVNSELAQKTHTGIIDYDTIAHRNEHSIEVQLPFLQYVAKEKKFDFVPIAMMMQDVKTATDVGMILAEVINKSEKKIVIIASSDFSHAGFNYMSMPPEGIRVDRYAKSQDKYAIEKILDLDAKGLVETVHDKNISMCGYGPVASMLVAAKKLGATTAELLKYGTSYEVHSNTSCVGYGALVVY